jgi:NHLM bacteriocin system ABC transporter peptidase/ATP-binding protein
MEAVECGAASLSIILSYFGLYVPLEQLRIECGVSRDGSKANNVLKAARKFGLTAKGFKKELEDLPGLQTPMILFWNFNHFLVLEGFKNGKAYIQDPAAGPREISLEELDQSYTGVVLTFEKTPEFKKGGRKTALLPALVPRLKGSEMALAFAIVTGLFLVIPGLLVPTFGRIFVDDVLLAGRVDWRGPLLIGMGLTALVRGFLTFLQQRYLLRLQTKLALSSSAKFFWHVLQLPIDFFNQRFPGELSSRVQINDKVADLLSGQLATNAISACTVVFYAAVMYAYDGVLTTVGICFALLNIVALRWVSRKRVDESQKLLRARGQVMGVAMGGIQMMETLKSTGTESEFFAEWSGHYAKSLNAEQKLGVFTSWLNAVPPLLSGLNNVALITVGGLRVMEGHLSVGMLVAFQSLMQSFMDPITKLVGLGGQLQEMQGDVNRLDDVLMYKADPQVAASESEAQAADEVVKLEGTVELRNVTFGYSRLEKPLIEGFSLTIKPGQRVALVGGSGSGKSTVAKLVSGLYEPWEGEILFDGKTRRETPRAVLNNSIGLVDQDITMFGGTIRENLTLWDETVAETDLVQACRDASIHDDVVQRTDGYKSTVNEGGANFSGGQRQRLEIARALVWNPTVLVLDEATSALDSATEKAIDDSLRRRGCTCLIVAHRLSTIRDADEIVVMYRGRVVERGTHEDLKSQGGAYAKLIED